MGENPKIRSFTDLKAWQEAHKLTLMIYKVTEKFPESEIFGLTNQMRRSAVSIGSNIAEGFSRFTARDKCQFYSVALGSLTELQSQLLVVRDVGYITNNLFRDVSSQTVLVSKLINGLRRIRNT